MSVTQHMCVWIVDGCGSTIALIDHRMEGRAVVRWSGATCATVQFMFAEEPTLSGAGMTRFGILGAAGIAPAALIVPAGRRDDVQVVAAAARDADRARRFANAHSIERAYGSYVELLADADVDVVYVALPPSEHARWSIAALEAGKHVLCEKPFSMDAAEAGRVVEVAERVKRRVVEAFHDHYHPLWERTLQIAGLLGRIDRIEGDFLVANPFKAGTIRHEPALGGGALMDLGCYPLHWVRNLIGQEPEVVEANRSDNPSGADMAIEAELLFPSGATGRVRASMCSDEFVDERRVIGERGWLTVERVVFPTMGHVIRWEVDGVEHVETVGGRQTYDHQLERVVDALRSGSALPTEGVDIVANMRAIDAIQAASRR